METWPSETPSLRIIFCIPNDLQCMPKGRSFYNIDSKIKLTKILKVSSTLKMHYSFKSTPTCTMKSRTETVTKSNQSRSRPGPTDYNVKKSTHNSGSIAQTHQKREVFKPAHNPEEPGPGAYEAKSYIKDGPKRTMSARLIRSASKGPGPASYNTDMLGTTHNKSPNWSMSKRSKSAQKIIDDHNREFNKADPMSYTTDFNTISNLKNKGRILMGTSQRKDLTETEKTPGPNVYQSSVNLGVKAPHYSMGNDKRELQILKSHEETPGPAFYDSRVGNSESQKGFSCRQKLRNLIAEELARYPAPGNYDTIKNLNQVRNSSARYSPSKQKRRTFIDDSVKNKQYVPGPSSSDQKRLETLSKYRATSAKSFSRSQRRPLDESQKTPSPFEYNKQFEKNKNAFLSKSPAYSQGREVSKKEFLQTNGNTLTPGPGSHDPNYNATKSKTIGFAHISSQQRPFYQNQRKKPGVGDYNVSPAKKAKFAMSKEKRIAFTDQRNEAKNGTFYDISSKVVDPPSYMRVSSKIKYPTNEVHGRPTAAYDSPKKSIGMASTNGF